MRRARGLLGFTLALGLAVGVPGAGSASHPQVAPPRCESEGGPATAAPTTSLRVANYNVLHGNTEEPPAYPARTTLDERVEISAQQLFAAGVDVVGMQEVSETVANATTGHLSGNVAERLATRLAELTGVAWHWCYYTANPHFPGEPDLQQGGGGPLSNQLAALAYGDYASFKEGAAILSRYPITDAEARRLPSRLPAEHAFCPPDEVPDCNLTIVFESRVALWASIATPGGATHIVTSHLSNDVTAASDASVLAQAAALMAFSEEKALAAPPARRFLTCDCNVKETDSTPVIAAIGAAGWTDTFRALNPNDPGYTAGPDAIVTPTPARTHDERIDYVFWRAGSCATAPFASAIFMNTPVPAPVPYIGGYLWPSDHLGVHTDLGVSGCS